MQETILEFIARRFKDDCNWVNGNCLWFALILQMRFPSLKICYLPITGHFVVQDNNNLLYDWKGLVQTEENPLELNQLKQVDYTWYSRLMRDCYL